jgi:hypothetical protein
VLYDNRFWAFTSGLLFLVVTVHRISRQAGSKVGVAVW